MMRSTLFEFWQQSEIRAGRRLSVSEVSRTTGVSRSAIQRLLDGETLRFDGPTINALCKFFDVPAGPIPFLVYDPEADREDNQS